MFTNSESYSNVFFKKQLEYKPQDKAKPRGTVEIVSSHDKSASEIHTAEAQANETKSSSFLSRIVDVDYLNEELESAQSEYFNFIYNNYVDISKVSPYFFIETDAKKAEAEGVTLGNFPGVTYYQPHNVADDEDEFDFESSQIAKNVDLGITIMHGLSSSPADCKMLADYIINNHDNAVSKTIYRGRITGHGSSINVLHETSLKDMFTSFNYAYGALNKCKRRVFIGHSFSCLLATLLVRYYPYDKYIFLTPSFSIKLSSAKLSLILPPFIKEIKNRKKFDPENTSKYDKWSVSAVNKLNIGLALLDQAPETDIEAVGIFSTQDGLLHNEKSQRIFRSKFVNSKIYQINSLAGHNILDRYDEKIFETVLNNIS